MSSETGLKLAFGAAFVAIAVTGTMAARRATARHGGTVNQLAHEVPVLIRIRGALGLVFYATLLAWLFGVDPAVTRLDLPVAARWGAVAIIGAVLLLYAWSSAALGTNYRGGVGLYESHELVTTGPYRWVRHPIYLAFILMMIAVTILSANWVLGLSGLLLVVSIPALRLPQEERELDERFGAAWREYRAVTGAFLPRF